MVKRSTFFEHSGYLDDGKISRDLYGLFSREEALYLHDLSKSLVRGGEIFSFGMNTINANNYVGVLRYGRREIEILPKLLEVKQSRNSIIKNLMYMLEYTTNIDHGFTKLASQGATEGTILEIYIGLFAKKLFALGRKFLPHAYVNYNESLKYKRGKLDLPKQLKSGNRDASKFHCEYDQYNDDNIVTQTLKYVTRELIKLSSNQTNRKHLHLALQRMSEVADKKVTTSELQSISIPRSFGEYVELMDLAKMFLANLRQDLASRNASNAAVVFDMNVVFEQFITKFIERNKNKLGVKEVYYQQPKRLVSSYQDLIQGTDSKLAMQTFTDILLVMKDGSRVIIDTKYKIINKNEEQKYNISNNDIYQITTYYDLHKFDGNSKVILLYPQSKSQTHIRLNLLGNLPPVYVSTVNLHQDLSKASEVLCEELGGILNSTSSPKESAA